MYSFGYSHDSSPFSAQISCKTKANIRISLFGAHIHYRKASS